MRTYIVEIVYNSKVVDSFRVDMTKEQKAVIECEENFVVKEV